MAVVLPPRPQGDVGTTWALIGQLRGYRTGLLELQRGMATLLEGTSHLQGMYLLSLATTAAGGAAEVAAAVAALDSTCTQLTTAVRQLEHELHAWQATCAQLEAAK